MDWSATLTGEMLLFGLLGKCLYRIPEPAWLQTLVDEDVFSEAPFANTQPDVQRGLAALQSWAHAVPQDKLDSEEINVDYTRLFTGVGRVLAPPWESVHFGKERLLFQERTLQVRGWYRRYGLQAEDLYHEPDDHVSLELTFLAHLARLGLEALERDDQPAFEQLLEAQRDFLEQHALLWIPHWTVLVENQAQSAFTKGVALLVRGSLVELAGIFEVPVPAEVRE